MQQRIDPDPLTPSQAEHRIGQLAHNYAYHMGQECNLIGPINCVRALMLTVVALGQLAPDARKQMAQCLKETIGRLKQ